ncbi:MAG: CBS domain-containing protein [Stellaceae bacterium]
MKASDIMTRGALTVAADSTVEAAARLMLSHRISGLPVVDSGGAVIGMVTEGDLLRRTEIGTELRRGRWLELLLGPGRLAREYVHSHARKVDEVMTREVASIGPETPLAEAVALMEKRHVKRLPVIDQGQLVGILSRANLLSALLELLAAPVPGASSDREIRARLLAEIDKQRWAPRACVDVAVADGIVELRGAITDERERAALRVAAENLPGVKGIRDHLVWVEPVSGMVIDR